MNEQNTDIVTQLINAVPAKTSDLRKVRMLEAGVLYGTADELKQIISKYKAFDYNKEAVLECLQIKDIEKLRLVKNLCGKYFYIGWPSRLKAKYNDYVETLMEWLIANKCQGEIFAKKDVDEFINTILPDSHIEPDVVFGNSDSIDMIFDLISSELISAHDILAMAIIHGNFKLAKDLARNGAKISFDGWDYGLDLSKVLSEFSVEDATFALEQFARFGEEKKYLLNEYHMLEAKDVMNDVTAFDILCRGFDISRYCKRDLIDFFIESDNVTNLKYIVDNGITKFNRTTIADAINYAEDKGSKDCKKYLIQLKEERFEH